MTNTTKKTLSTQYLCEEFFKDIGDVVPSFINMSDFDKWKFIFSSNDLDICKMCILVSCTSSTPELHNLNILSSAGVFRYLPFSIFKLLLLILILTNVDIDFVFI
jgi:hypothetical protein